MIVHLDQPAYSRMWFSAALIATLCLAPSTAYSDDPDSVLNGDSSVLDSTLGGEDRIAPDLLGSIDLEKADLSGDGLDQENAGPAVDANSDVAPMPKLDPALPAPSIAPTITEGDAAPSKSASAPHEKSPQATPYLAEAIKLPSPAKALQLARPDWLRPLSPAEVQLRNRVRHVLQTYSEWRLNTRDHSPWEILHAIVAHGTESQVLLDGPRGESVTAVGWLCFNRPFRNMELMVASPHGIRTRQGPGYEGHHGQFLGMLAQARVMRDYPMRIGNQKFTIEDLIKYEQRTCYPRTELTFKLIGLNYYLEPDATWKNDRGESWDIARLVREEVAQPIRGVACGGTHRLEGMSMAIRKRERLGLPIEGGFAQAKRVVREYQLYTFRLQNRDGSFSTEWFRGRGAETDEKRRMRTSGHQLEWLVVSLPDEELRRTDLQRGVAYLAGLLWRGRQQEWDAGLLGHSINALKLYDQRLFRRVEKYDRKESLAKKSEAKSSR